MFYFYAINLLNYFYQSANHSYAEILIVSRFKIDAYGMPKALADLQDQTFLFKVGYD